MSTATHIEAGEPNISLISPDGVTRRSFLRYLGLGTASLLVAADGVLAYRTYDQGVFGPARGPAFEALDTWRNGSGVEAMVAAAVLAASAHNTQPWVFAVGDEGIDLYADRTRTTGANDPLLREFNVSLGCALENLTIEARAQGYQPIVTLDPGGDADLVASVELRAGNREVDELHAAIGTRRSNRSIYTADPLPDGTIGAMEAVVDETVAPARLVWLTGPDERAAFSDLLVEATASHNADEEQSKDSYAWWRGSWDEVQEHRDGLNLNGVGLPPLVRTIGKLLPNTSREDSDATFLERTRLQADSAAAFGVVVVDDPHALPEQLAGGRLLQRLHLWAAAHNLGFQHMNQITERIDRDLQLGRPNPFTEPLARLVGRAPALAAFRIGTPTVAALPSPRRQVSEVLA
jgi:nitroreductase